MTCDDVRDALPEHILGTLEPETDDRVRSHLRGCGACRAEMHALGEGLGSFARASHDRQTPPELRERVLSVLVEEWSAAPAAPGRDRRHPIVASLAAAAVVAALAWGVTATVRLDRAQDAAAKYEAFLATLGGEDVRVGALSAPDPRSSIQGSVVIYDSNVGQSWVLVLCRAPGWTGTANVTLVSRSGETIDLPHPMEFGEGGEGSAWLVTSSDLERFDRVNVWDDGGVLASATVRHD